MPLISFELPAPVDHGPAPDLWSPVRVVGDELANRYQTSNETRARAFIPDVFQYKLKWREKDIMRRALGDLATAVRDNYMFTRSLQVERHLKDGDASSRSWHADTRAASFTQNPDSSWDIEIRPQEGHLGLMSLDGPSPLGVSGILTLDSDDITTIDIATTPRVVNRGQAYSASSAAIDQLFASIPTAVMGVNGELLRLALGADLDPRLGLTVHQADEGNLAEFAEVALHHTPEGIKAGRNLLQMLSVSPHHGIITN